jgi:hypothetical protein
LLAMVMAVAQFFPHCPLGFLATLSALLFRADVLEVLGVHPETTFEWSRWILAWVSDH